MNAFPHMNPFEVLAVSRFAPIEVINAAYRALSKKYHPDMGAIPDENAMKLINAAYEALKDPDTREQWLQQTRPIPPQRFTFGKYYGKYVAEAPFTYLEWLIKNEVGTPAIQTEARELVALHQQRLQARAA